MSNKQYFQLVTAGNSADLHIYGDITSYPWKESDVTAYNLSAQLAALQNVDNINVYINSYGGEVAEGLAIYNALKRHPAKVTTYCDGMACSIASVIFMAGDERRMNKASLLMIHNAWTWTEGNAEELRKQADDLDKITSASIAAYLTHVSLSKPKLREMMDAETWLTPKEAVRYGFATSIDDTDSEHVEQSARKHIFARLMKAMQATDDEEEEDDVDAPEAPQNEPDNPDDESVDDNDSDDSEGNPEPEVTSDDDKDDEEDEQSKDPDPAQRWSGFFNALIRE